MRLQIEPIKMRTTWDQEWTIIKRILVSLNQTVLVAQNTENKIFVTSSVQYLTNVAKLKAQTWLCELLFLFLTYAVTLNDVIKGLGPVGVCLFCFVLFINCLRTLTVSWLENTADYFFLLIIWGIYIFNLIDLPFVRRTYLFLFSRPKEKQETYEVMERDSFYKKGEIGKSHDKKQKHLEHRLNKL